MFLPMSWTSPFTVAITIVPARRPVPSRCSSRYGIEVRDGLLHDPGALDDLGQEHAPGPEPVADDVHARHQRALDDVERPLRRAAAPPRCPRRSRRRCPRPARASAARRPAASRQPRSSTARGRPRRRRAYRGAISSRRSVASGRRSRTTSSTRSQQVRVDVVVLRQGTGVDDRHVEAGADRVVQEHGVDRLADAVVAAEREATRWTRRPLIRASGQLRLEAARGLEERRSRSGRAPRCPVAIAKMFGSRMMSSGAKPACSVSSR